MKLYFSALLLLILALVQVTEGHRMAIAGALPALVLVAVVSWGVLRGGLEALTWAILGGFWLDLFSGFPAGSHIFALVVVAFLVSLGERALFQSNFALPMILMFVATFAYELTLLLLAGASGRQVVFEVLVPATVFPAAIYNAVVFPLAHLLLTRVDRRYPVPVQPEW